MYVSLPVFRSLSLFVCAGVFPLPIQLDVVKNQQKENYIWNML